MCFAIKPIPFVFRSMSFMNCDFVCGRKFSLKGRMGAETRRAKEMRFEETIRTELTFHVLTKQFLLQAIGQQIKVKGHSYV